MYEWKKNKKQNKSNLSVALLQGENNSPFLPLLGVAFIIK
jgi:hypothetical protein